LPIEKNYRRRFWLRGAFERRRFRKRNNWDNPDLPLSLSIGLPTAASSDTDLEEVYRKADSLMFQERKARQDDDYSN